MSSGAPLSRSRRSWKRSRPASGAAGSVSSAGRCGAGGAPAGGPRRGNRGTRRRGCASGRSRAVRLRARMRWLCPQPTPPRGDRFRLDRSTVGCGVRPCDTADRMDPSRKRRIRLVVALTTALLLASALIYTSFSASSESVQPSKLLAGATPERSYQLTGKVVPGSIHRGRDAMTFRVRDRAGSRSVPVRYSGTVPDPFRDGREVIVTVRKQGATFVGERDSLVTKCPSKFTDSTS